ncbi:MAG: WD40 repeat domain-containing protein [Candidatus Eisenbacteria bacterium]|nr:WD40 repeat domain-containing protein [Candidatus Eisenbacteria bacterium]
MSNWQRHEVNAAQGGMSTVKAIWNSTHGVLGRVSLATTALAGVALVLTADPAAAVRTRYLRTEGYDAWKKGTLEGTALSEDGRLLPAPKIERLGDPGARSLWALASTGDGPLFVASGDQGQVFVQEGSGEPRLLASVFNYELFCAAPDGKGGCYVAGAPAGSIIRVGGDGTTRTIFDAPEGLILALLRDPSGGVYAAAGERGRLYRVSDAGDSKVVSESGDLHLRCLAWSSDGKKILAGTDGRGLVQEIDVASGKLRTVYDAAEQEIVTVVPIADGGAYFASNPGEPQGGGGAGGSGEDDEGAGGMRGPAPTVYRLDASGSVRPIWKAREQTIHALLVEPEGSLLVATGSAGAVYRIDESGHETILWRAEEEQVLCLARHRGEVYAGTANPGRLYRLDDGPNPEASYTSEVFDAQDQARWGAIRWTGEAAGGKVSFETRSGYTSLPDESWSGWTGGVVDPLGAPVTSPIGRFLQWRVKLTAGSAGLPSVRRVEVAHLGANRAPEIASLSISPDEPQFQGGEKHGGGVTQTLPNGIEIDYSVPPGPVQAIVPNDVPTALRQLRSIIWDVDDPDNDEMAFRLEIRQVGEDAFRLIEKDLSDPAHSLETGLLPDGLYEIRLTVSDAPGNPPGTERTVQRLTPPFRVDNVAPTVTELKARKVEGPALLVSGTAQDLATPLRRMAVSVDGGAFRALSPADGILDSPREAFEARVPLDSAEKGNWVVVRVQDAAGNNGSYRAWLE